MNLKIDVVRTKKCGTLHDFACHPCAAPHCYRDALKTLSARIGYVLNIFTFKTYHTFIYECKKQKKM